MVTNADWERMGLPPISPNLNEELGRRLTSLPPASAPSPGFFPTPMAAVPRSALAEAGAPASLKMAVPSLALGSAASRPFAAPAAPLAVNPFARPAPSPLPASPFGPRPSANVAGPAAAPPPSPFAHPPRSTTPLSASPFRPPASALAWFRERHPEAELTLAPTHSRGLDWLADQAGLGSPRAFYCAEGMQAWLVQAPTDCLVFRPGNLYCHTPAGDFDVPVDRQDLLEIQLQIWPDSPTPSAPGFPPAAPAGRQPPMPVDWFRQRHPDAWVDLAADDSCLGLDPLADQAGIGSPRAYHFAEGTQPLDNALLVSGPSSCLLVGPDTAVVHTVTGDFEPNVNPHELKELQRRLWPTSGAETTEPRVEPRRLRISLKRVPGVAAPAVGLPVATPTTAGVSPVDCQELPRSVAATPEAALSAPVVQESPRAPTPGPAAAAPDPDLDWFAREHSTHGLFERDIPPLLKTAADSAGIHDPRRTYLATTLGSWLPDRDFWLVWGPNKTLVLDRTTAYTHTPQGQVSHYDSEDLVPLREELWDLEQRFQERFLYQDNHSWLDRITGESVACPLSREEVAVVAAEAAVALDSLEAIPGRPADGAPLAEVNRWLEGLAPLQPAEAQSNKFQPSFAQIQCLAGPMMAVVRARFPDARVVASPPNSIWLRAAQVYTIDNPFCFELIRESTWTRFRNDCVCVCGVGSAFVQSPDGCVVLYASGEPPQEMPDNTHGTLVASLWGVSEWLKHLNRELVPLINGKIFVRRLGAEWTLASLKPAFERSACYVWEERLLKRVNPIDAWLDARPLRFSKAVFDPRPATGDVYHFFDPWALAPRLLTHLPDLTFLYEVVCDRRPLLLLFLLYWVKQIREHPEKPNRTALVFLGLPDTGKSCAGKMLCDLLAPHATVLKNAKLASEFKGLQADKLLIFFEDAVLPEKPEQAANFRAQIGGGQTDIRDPHRKAVTAFVANNFVIGTNHANAVTLMGPDDTKMMYIPFSAHRRADTSYFAALERRWTQIECQRTLALIAALPSLANGDPPLGPRAPPAFLFEHFPELGFFAWLLREQLDLRFTLEGRECLLPIWHPVAPRVCNLDQLRHALIQREAIYRQLKPELQRLDLEGELDFFRTLLGQVFYPELVERKETVAEAREALVAFTKDTDSGYKVHFAPLPQLQRAFARRIGQSNFFQVQN